MENKAKNKPLVIFILILFSIVMILFIYLGVYFSKMTKSPFSFTLSQNEITIDGWGSAKIDINDIKEVQLIKEPLKVISNNGGGTIGNKIFGDENIENYGNVKCFVENLTQKSIIIKTNNYNYIINFNSNEETIKKFNQIKSVLIKK